MTLKRWIGACCAVGLLLGLFLLWIVQDASIRKNVALGQWREKIQQIRALTKDGKVIPSVDLLRNFEKQRLHFAAKLNDLLVVLRKTAEMPGYDNPLEFKGDLFKVQHSLLARAQAMSVGVPPDIGFTEFTGKEIPPASELEGLSFQLAKIKDFLGLLLDCPVEQVKELTRGPAGQQRIEPDEEVPFYQDFSFDVHFICSGAAFRKFLSLLLNATSVFVLENLEVRLQSENSLDVEATVKAVSFTNATPSGAAS